MIARFSSYLFALHLDWQAQKKGFHTKGSSDDLYLNFSILLNTQFYIVKLYQMKLNNLNLINLFVISIICIIQHYYIMLPMECKVRIFLNSVFTVRP